MVELLYSLNNEEILLLLNNLKKKLLNKNGQIIISNTSQNLEKTVWLKKYNYSNL